MRNTRLLAVVVLFMCLFSAQVESGKESRRQKSSAVHPKESCVENGVHYDVGDKFTSGCNSCACIQGGIPVCALIQCLPLTTQRPSRTRSRRPQSGCEANGQQYSVGARFKVDCNWCSCKPRGRVACTKIFCAPKTEPPPIMGCLVGGVQYAVGQGFNRDCNTCTCTDTGFPICTLIDCSAAVSATTTVQPAGCVDNGVLYEVGETYLNDCNTCTCTSAGVSACTLRACLPSDNSA